MKIWEFAPDNFHESTHKEILKYIRIFLALFSVGNFLWALILTPDLFFIYLTCWGLTITMIYFIVAALSYFSTKLTKVAYILFETIWAIESCITVMYWTAVAPLSSIDVLQTIFHHVVPIITLTFDFCLNRVEFIRKHMVFPLGISIIYLLCVNMPYALEVEEVYPLMSFRNVWSYLMILGALIVEVIAFEGALQLKRKLGICTKSVDIEMNSNNYEIDGKRPLTS
ncbi:unnamed protein product [Blepharisma stoltei]|uniref:Uncharacterized protein n=1 Tax=Blepharisma stoltei TaxID=1481888 RepID=A0AAU9IS43_9CILI|nr:unnamed protein product [Blepharisma stoltei]